MKTTKVSGSEEDYEIEDILYFRVTDGDKEGTCYSWYDHFDVVWDNGDFLTTIELSLFNIRKVSTEGNKKGEVK